MYHCHINIYIYIYIQNACTCSLRIRPLVSTMITLSIQFSLSLSLCRSLNFLIMYSFILNNNNNNNNQYQNPASLGWKESNKSLFGRTYVILRVILWINSKKHNSSWKQLMAYRSLTENTKYCFFFIRSRTTDCLTHNFNGCPCLWDQNLKCKRKCKRIS